MKKFSFKIGLLTMIGLFSFGTAGLYAANFGALLRTVYPYYATYYTSANPQGSLHVMKDASGKVHYRTVLLSGEIIDLTREEANEFLMDLRIESQQKNKPAYVKVEGPPDLEYKITGYSLTTGQMGLEAPLYIYRDGQRRIESQPITFSPLTDPLKAAVTRLDILNKNAQFVPEGNAWAIFQKNLDNYERLNFSDYKNVPEGSSELNCNLPHSSDRPAAALAIVAATPARIIQTSQINQGVSPTSAPLPAAASTATTKTSTPDDSEGEGDWHRDLDAFEREEFKHQREVEKMNRDLRVMSGYTALDDDTRTKIKKDVAKYREGRQKEIEQDIRNNKFIRIPMSPGAIARNLQIGMESDVKGYEERLVDNAIRRFIFTDKDKETAQIYGHIMGDHWLEQEAFKRDIVNLFRQDRKTAERSRRNW